MIDTAVNFPFLVLLVGTLIVINIFIKSWFGRWGIPSLVGYILLGFLLRITDVQQGFLTLPVMEIFEFLATIGVITLLFRIGLESNLSGLIHQIRHASIIWVGNVFLSGFLGFVVPYLFIKLALIPSMFIAIALTATSVGLSVGVWQEADALHSPTGELLTDVAELDDISGIVLMALLFAVVPVLKNGEHASLVYLVSKEIGLIMINLIAFGMLCVLFSLYAEQHITHFFQDIESASNPMLVTVGTGFVIAALAGLLGFSVAIGAFFAGLLFSRDPQAVKIDASFGALYEFFSPFFFIGVGLHIDPGAVTTAIGLGTVLLIVAVVGKVIGGGVPTWMVMGWSSAVLLGVSIVPRAEIAMIIMQRGLNLGEWAVPHNVFAAMVMVTAVTCTLTPLAVRFLLQRWPQIEEDT